MIILFIVLIIFIFKLNIKSNKINGISILKNKLRVKALVVSKAILFCYQNLEYEIAGKITNNFTTFTNLTAAKNIIKTLKNAGLNLELPIYKIECYTKNNVSRNIENIDLNSLQRIYKILQAIKQLENKKISANYLIFIDDSFLYKSINKLISYFDVNAKIYVKDEVEYKLLAAINSLNVNINPNREINNILEEDCVNQTINLGKCINENQIKNNNKKLIELGNSININLTKSNNLKNFFLQANNQIFEFKNFDYNNYFLNSFLRNNMFNATLSATQNIHENAIIFKLNITNITNRNLAVNFNFFSFTSYETYKNAVYLVDSGKSHIYLSNLIIANSGTILVGNFNVLQARKQYIFSQKKLNVSPKKSVEFYFLFSCNPQSILANESKIISTNILQKQLKNYVNNLILNLPNYYQDNDYNKVKLTKILTQNKTLNLLVNQYLPQKIIKNYIVNNFYFAFNKVKEISCYNQDFYNLQNNIFNNKLVDNSFNVQNLNSIFLLKNNLYKTYLNLIYFKLGFFASSSGLNLNPNKTQIENRAVVSLKQYFNNVTININKINLNNEIKIDSVRYTNLHFLNITPKTKNLHLQF